MTVDRRLEKTFAELARLRADARQTDNDPPLRGRGPGGTSGDMESRIARLESDMAHVKDTLKSIDTRVEATRKDIGGIQTDISGLKVEIKHLPGKGFIFAVATGLLAAAGGIMAAVVRFIPHAS